MNNEIKAGMWKKVSQKGNTYYSGKIKIENKEYYLTLFKNNKTNEKQPDLNIFLKDSINYQENNKQSNTEHKNSATSEDIYKEFGENIEIDDELGF